MTKRNTPRRKAAAKASNSITEISNTSSKKKGAKRAAASTETTPAPPVVSPQKKQKSTNQPPWKFQDADTFLMAKKVREDPPSDLDEDDDATVAPSNRIADQVQHLFASMMVSLPDDKEAAQAEAPIECLRRFNEMFQPLMNKFRNKVWLTTWGDTPISTPTMKTQIPMDDSTQILNKAEEYLHDFNRFVSWGKRMYVRVHLVYLPTITASQRISQMSLCRIKGDGGQFFQKAHSDAYDPIAGGSLTGSVAIMAESPDFHKTFKQKWNLKHLGLHWSYTRSKNGGAYTVKKSALHIEIDRSDETKLKAIESFFNQKSTSVQKQFWGTPMQWVPQFDYSLSDEIHERIDRNKETQYKLGMSLKSCTVQGVHLYNFVEAEKTLHRRLMELESIHEKTINERSSNLDAPMTKRSFKDRLFYAIIPDGQNHAATFFYTSANAKEARSVAQALPRFLKTNLKINPNAFCTRSFIADTKEGHWEPNLRIYLSEDAMLEQKKLDLIDDAMIAQREVYIDPAHERALAADGESVADTVNTQLTLGDKVPAPVDSASQVSSMTGSTRQSKVATAVAAVSQQYSSQIQSLEATVALLASALKATGIQLPDIPTNIVTDSQNPIHINDDVDDPSDDSDFDEETDGWEFDDNNDVAMERAPPSSSDDDERGSASHSDGCNYGGPEVHALLNNINQSIEDSADRETESNPEEPFPPYDTDGEGSPA